MIRPRPAADLTWPERLDAACEQEDALRLVAQPIVDLGAGRVTGYELLARFDGPETPDVWFAAARTHGRGEALNALVLRRALHLRRTVPSNCFVTVNVEPDVLTSEAVTDVLLAGGQGSLGGIVIELTEHEPTGTGDDVQVVLDGVRAAGGLIAMDDVGTGYAGLSHLLAIRPDLVKVDRELVEGIDIDPARRRLVEVLGDLSGRIDAWLLAEGVETAGQCEVLLELGVPLAQGWYLGRPGEPWSELDGELQDRLRTVSARAALVEYVAPLVRELDASVEVALDVSGRPRSVRWRLGDDVLVSPPMTMAPSTTVVEAVHRALARDPRDRWAPLLVTDARGRLSGQVDMSDLVGQLASSAPGALTMGEHEEISLR